jgi:hypothetical protein
VFVDQLPFPHSFNPSAIAYLNNTVKNVLIHHIHPQYQLDVTFNFRDFILNFTTNLIHLFTHSIPYSFQQQECLNEILHDHLDHTAITAVSDNFRSLQYIFQSFKNIQTYLANFNISHFYAPSEECIQALMLQHCSSCVRDIPAMCQMTCELITGTCQSPIYDGLKYQLEAVWNVSSQLIQQLKYITHKTLLIDTLNILPASSIHSLNAQSNQQCNIDLLSLLSSRRKRNANDIISDFSLSHAKMNSLPRVFKYGDGIVSSNFCMKRSSSTNCWNISHILSHSSLIPYNISISDQTNNNNNAFQFDVASLNQQASCIGKPFMELLHDNTDLLSLRLNISIPSVVLPPTVSSNVCATPPTTSDTTTSATTHSTSSTQPIDIVGTPNAAHSLYQLTFLILLSLLLALLLT